ncbi:unnamed protein product [Fusarium graminearum]|uniref:Chromosome 2, complete genome n=1 Tax=Gibberella zeae (strain ATCC MYA-4620 / CBS 123657 / FGSC 9075 / NRRL 31084 / PH-1) TaxID=229533 RepID=A0A098DGE1_GIBZE|nr:unnamed protein product [Fusarium graminearum]
MFYLRRYEDQLFIVGERHDGKNIEPLFKGLAKTELPREGSNFRSPDCL